MGKPEKQPERSVLVEPRPVHPAATSRESAEDAAYNASRLKDQAQIDAINGAIERHNQIGRLLGANHYILNKVWPTLDTPLGLELRVSRFYFKINTAVDYFPAITPGIAREIEWKRRALKKMGIRYGALDYSMQLADLIPQIGLPSEVN